MTKLSVIFFIFIGSIGGGLCSERIVGGSEAADGAYPYQVALEIENTFFCGGSIIGRKWILSAAHCLIGQSAEKIRVVAGTVILQNGTGKEFEVESLKVHEKYSRKKNFNNDIGLLKLKNPIEFNEKIKSIPLANKKTESGSRLTVAGWGKTRKYGDTTLRLRKIELFSISVSECASTYEDDVDERNICTTGVKGKGTCEGDSGSPLVYDGKQVGVVSRGIPCAKGYPDIHIDVYSFKDWIKNNMKD